MCTKLGLLASLVSLLACGSSGPELETLTKGDVTGLPAGNATGASFSGTYVIASSVLGGCHCRQGPCSEIRASTGHGLVVTQTNGDLRVDENGDIYLGGINQDGRLRCGHSASTDVSTLFIRWEGTAVAEKSLDVVSDLTYVGTIDGQNYDCDAETHFQATYLGP